MAEQFAAWMRSVQTGMEKTLFELLPPENASTPLAAAMRYAVLDGGKRVRPLLVFAAGHLFDADESVLSRLAASVEMIHAYSLIHDDMPCMDNDVLRRGKPTVHVKFGEAMALLAGDALQAQAFSVLSSAGGKEDLAACRMKILSDAAGAAGMCGGQAVDLVSTGKKLSLGELEQMHRLKTGALLRASVMLGAFSERRPEEAEMKALEAYAKAAGLAFQVVDDILDVTEDSASLGKTAGKDALNGKPTYVSILGLEASKKLADELNGRAHEALAAFGKKADLLRGIADLIVNRKN